MTILTPSDHNENDRGTNKFQCRFEISLPQIQSGMDYSVQLMLKNITDEPFHILQIKQIKLNKKTTGLSICQTDHQRIVALEEFKNNLLLRILKINYYTNLRYRSSALPHMFKELFFILSLFFYSIFQGFLDKEEFDIVKQIKNESRLKEYLLASEHKINENNIPQQARRDFLELKERLNIVLQEIEDIRNGQRVIVNPEKESFIALYFGKAPWVSRIKKHEIIVQILYRAINSSRDEYYHLSKHIKLYPSFLCLILSVGVGAVATCFVIFFYLWINHPDILQTNLEKEVVNFLFRILITFVFAIPILGTPKTITAMLNETKKIPDKTISELSPFRLVLELIMRIKITDTTQGFILGIFLSILVDFIPFQDFISPLS